MKRSEEERAVRRELAGSLPGKVDKRRGRPVLSPEQVEARMLAFEEAADHLELAWAETDEEQRQGIIVAGIIREFARDWYLRLRARREDLA